MLVGISVKGIEYIFVGYGQLCGLLQYDVVQPPWPLTTSMTFVSTKSITEFCVFAIVLVAAQMLW
ncbi:hypothetical protein [common midwife toad virus -E]|uniref:Uncharacterized protein n=1 Tax=Common midwife toad virus TaxID=540070 RepID=H6WED7_9VIRU|nr:hypothetical protein [common midwife toad virus -E]